MSVIITRGGVPADFKASSLGSARVSSALDQDVENEAILVDSAPELVLCARDRDNDFVQMPFVTASGSALADPIGERLAEFPSPLAPGFIGHANATRRQHFLDHAQASAEPEIQPNGIADHFRWEAMAAMSRVVGMPVVHPLGRSNWLT
ncbi:hypothetical protein AB7M56_000247 [Bradyrhizobium elkanii]|nr:hypothetical protein [Bradyrhizobium elkanii]MCS3482250.1 hypothetical protein [Bradyrhizobium elkanii]MCS3525065.1 hypothetical protein [Bradyrhizobium elkanii]MCS4075723.1 hypothetical protein [Bradyrhizobium elkanii]MCS4085028.1 hypothetical protein [Bradyrhizobium elkanii]